MKAASSWLPRAPCTGSRGSDEDELLNEVRSLPTGFLRRLLLATEGRAMDELQYNCSPLQTAVPYTSEHTRCSSLFHAPDSSGTWLLEEEEGKDAEGTSNFYGLQIPVTAALGNSDRIHS